MNKNKITKGRHLSKLADSLTLFRLLVGLPIVIALGNGYFFIAWGLILISGISDIADGYLARKSGSGTVWGARFDPLADKLALSAPLIYLARNYSIPIWSLWLLISRELIITSWRSNQIEGGPASKAGKAKTILLFISVLFMTWPPSLGSDKMVDLFHNVGFILYWPSLFFSIKSAMRYLMDQSTDDQNLSQ